MHRKPLHLCLYILLGSLLVGCGPETQQTTGGEDFPNAITAMKDSVLARLGSVSEVAPLEGVSPSVTLEVAAEAPQDVVATPTAEVPTLGKTVSATALDTISVDLSDTANGTAKLILHQPILGGVQRDTVVMRWDEWAKDEIEDNENIVSLRGAKVYRTGLVESYSFLDDDGDGLVNSKNGCAISLDSGCQLAKYRFVATTINGRSVITEHTISCGIDGDFDQEGDNAVRISQVLTLSALGDTLKYEVMSDADGDGWITPLQASDSSFVLVHSQGFLSDFVSRVAEVGILYFPADTMRNRLFLFEQTDFWGAGGSKTSSIVPALSYPDSYFPGDTLRVEEITRPGFAGRKDSILEAFVFIAGEGFDESRNLIIELESQSFRGEDGRSLFWFRPNEPLQAGSEPADGHLRFELDLADGRSFWIDGILDSSGVHAAYGDAGGFLDSVSWDQ